MSTADDRLAVVDLVHRYSSALTRRAWAEAEALFAPDAVWESPELRMRFENPRDFFASFAGAPDTEVFLQYTHDTVVDFTGPDHARATTTVVELIRKTDAANVAQYALYVDDVARVDGEWKFTHRRFRPLYVDTGAVTGRAFPVPPELSQ